MLKITNSMERALKRNYIFPFFAVCIFLMPALIAAQADKQDFSLFNDLQIENNSIKIITSNAVKYNIFKISNPPRLVAELFNTEHDMKQKEFNLDNGVIKRIRTGQFQNQPAKVVRVVIDLAKMVDYEATQNGNMITISLLTGKEDTQPATTTENSEKESQASVPAVAEAPVPTAPPAQSEPPAEVKSNNSSQPPVAIEKKEEVKKPAVKPKKPVKIKTAQAKKTKPSSTESKKTNLVLPKIPVTLEYQDADIKDILQVMSIRSGINIIYGPDVVGTVTISLRNVPFDQAFQTILSLKGLTTMVISDNIIRVVTPTTLKDERQKEITVTKIFPLNYADAAVIQSQITSVLGAQEVKGTITTDQRTNSLIVTATPEGLNTVERLLQELDLKPQQVSIEAKIIDLTISDITDLGVNWNAQNIVKQGAGALTMPTATQNAGSASVLQPAEPGTNNVQVTEVASNMPVPTGGNFNFGYVTANNVLNMKLGALITAGKAKVLSNPRVTTLNNKVATIMSGEKVPYQTVTVSNGVSQSQWQFLDAGIQLTVTPTISPDGWITLKVTPTVNTPEVSPAGQPPSTKNRSTDVTVMVKNNDTLVIGGLITENDIDSIQRVPVLSDLPILGYFFSYKEKNTARTELLIFITPSILPD